nr:immunoglobulin light chain junction region [Macaca mulatta]MOY10504.1 immunoglobulin light chain junction region [Macaca mulatta]MOY10588.1 immunoglobulin light chain junction region [Macaca mulatta]MOY10604.1 immunoglobulin light chain junction region [Macaca mulatta]MOY10664.1 immunoglobulin light chain junction region [Macaca mulatta]
CYQRSSGYIF